MKARTMCIYFFVLPAIVLASDKPVAIKKVIRKADKVVAATATPIKDIEKSNLFKGLFKILIEIDKVTNQQDGSCVVLGKTVGRTVKNYTTEEERKFIDYGRKYTIVRQKDRYERSVTSRLSGTFAILRPWGYEKKKEGRQKKNLRGR